MDRNFSGSREASGAEKFHGSAEYGRNSWKADLSQLQKAAALRIYYQHQNWCMRTKFSAYTDLNTMHSVEYIKYCSVHVSPHLPENRAFCSI